jgi:serine acetyltransferase
MESMQTRWHHLASLSSVHFVTLHACSHILWCRRRDLGILVSAAMAAIALGIKITAWLVGA